jgi:glycyl-tRNA synthetase beta chain
VSAQDLLIEIGTEELPPTALLKLSKSFEKNILAGLHAATASFNGKVKSFASPRRLAVTIDQLDELTHPQTKNLSGPNKKVAFDYDGNPTKAALGFAKKCGVSVEDLRLEGDKLVYSKKPMPIKISSLLQNIVETSLKQLPIPKRMRWGASRIEFVRPVHWIVMLLGNQVVDAEVMGIKAGNQTRGHRFHCNRKLTITAPSDYQNLLLNEGHVVADFEIRREEIVIGINDEAEKLGGTAIIDPALLDEVTSLVEKPVALAGHFDPKFLAVPAEALISSMGAHQKYFHVVDKNGKLLPSFITISNIQSADENQVIRGNERVIHPRLSDAAFFFETDKKIRLADRRKKLSGIVFQEKLGTVLQKTDRIAALAEHIATEIGADCLLTRRAGELCKVDLVSDMVLEFDKMQGIAGRYYAQHDGEEEDVALAIEQHYLPRYAGDKLPDGYIASAVALADRIDTLTGIFGIGQPPTGSKDPFALRRASIAVLQIIVQKQLPLDLLELLNRSCQLHQKLNTDDQLVDKILSYMLERFRAWYQDEGIAAEVFMAVSAKKLSAPLDIHNRVQAVHAFSQLAESQALAAANKRVSNILNKAREGEVASRINSALLIDGAERLLAEQLLAKQSWLVPLLAEQKYDEILAGLVDLRQPVDAFFDGVMVMVDDANIRANRLALLTQLRGLFLQVADISCLASA